MSMKKLLSLLLALALCASLALPALAAEGADPGPSSGAEPGVEIAPSVEPGIAPSDAPETAPIDPATASETEAPPETGETAPIDPNAETAAPGTETAETDPETTETVETEMPLVVSFSDVPASHTFYAGITYCAGKGIVGGYPDGTFKPANTVTKNHFCAMLARRPGREVQHGLLQEHVRHVRAYQHGPGAERNSGRHQLPVAVHERVRHGHRD